MNRRSLFSGAVAVAASNVVPLCDSSGTTMILHRQVWPSQTTTRYGGWVECYNPDNQEKCVITHNATNWRAISFEHLTVTKG